MQTFMRYTEAFYNYYNLITINTSPDLFLAPMRLALV
jgi:hypothetical protein